MSAGTWRVDVDGATHRVEARRSWIGGITVRVDGAVALRTPGSGVTVRVGGARVLGPSDTPPSAGRYPVPVGGRTATLLVTGQGRSFVSFDLVLDGRSLSTGGQPRPTLSPGQGWLLVLLGVCLLTIAQGLVFVALPELRLVTGGRETDALVASRYETYDRSTTTYHVRYDFVTADGSRVTANGVVSAEMYARATPGSTIRVLYLPEDPSTQRPAAYNTDVWFALFIAVFGVAAVVVWLAYRRGITLEALRAGKLVRTTAAVERVTNLGPASGLATITYRYTAEDGVERVGTSDPLYAEESAAYPPGSSATIAYDPRRPGVSVWIGASDPSRTAWVTAASRASPR
jgi:Protein of unknown function (DUF3592)